MGERITPDRHSKDLRAAAAWWRSPAGKKETERIETERLEALHKKGLDKPMAGGLAGWVMSKVMGPTWRHRITADHQAAIDEQERQDRDERESKEERAKNAAAYGAHIDSGDVDDKIERVQASSHERRQDQKTKWKDQRRKGDQDDREGVVGELKKSDD